MANAERQYLQAALAKAGGVRTRASELLKNQAIVPSVITQKNITSEEK